MNISHAILTREPGAGDCLHVTIDGITFWAGDKYTIIEMGYSFYMVADEAKPGDAAEWIESHAETLPADHEDGRSEMRWSGSAFLTSDAILSALAYKVWWHSNGVHMQLNEPLRIPSFEEAVEIQRNRRIMNGHNRKFAGKIPSDPDYPLKG